jgi:hypothetical protein
VLLPVPKYIQQQQQQADRPLLLVTVTLNPNLDELSLFTASSSSSPSSTSAAALYITARPNTVDNVPRAILDGSMGKPPPVLVARIPNVTTFPFQVILTSKDVTVEGGATSTTTTTSLDISKYTVEDCHADGDNDPNYSNNYWWLPGGGGGAAAAAGLVVSARLDSDGLAATRDPTDFVGRTTILLRPTSTTASSAVQPQQDQQHSSNRTNDSCQPSLQQEVVASVTVELQGRGVAGKFFTSQKNR